MSTYPVDVKSVNHSAVGTHAVFAGPARAVGIYLSKEKSLAASTVTLKDDSTVLAHFDVPATNNSVGAGITQYVQFPGTGFRASTALKFEIATTATSVTLLHG